MRDVYHEELDSIGRTLVEMTSLVADALDQATAALLKPDLHAAESVIAADDTIDAAQRDLDARVLDLIARQQPVAGDLRTLVTSVRMSADLERMGDLARHIAKVARLRHPHSAVPEELRESIAAMGALGSDLARKVGHVIEDRDVDAARTLEADDDAVDQLHKALFTTLLSDENPYTIEAAIDITLIGRYYERFADHAVSVATRLIFLITGEDVRIG